MYCRNCDGWLDNKAVICTSCGVNPTKGLNYCQHCGAETNPKAEICVNCGIRVKNIGFNTGEKSKLAAGLLGIFLGGLGVHRFYLGNVEIGIVQLVLTLVLSWCTLGITAGIASLWGFIEGILILTGAINQDSQGMPLRD